MVAYDSIHILIRRHTLPTMCTILANLLFSFVNSMEKILERYERYSYAERQHVANDQPQNVGHQLLYQSIFDSFYWFIR